MLDKLLTEQSNQLSQDLDRLPVVELLGVMNAAAAEIAAAVEREIPRIGRAVEARMPARGGTPSVLGGVGAAGKLGAVTWGLSCAPDPEWSSAVDFPMDPAPGPETVTGSPRLRAGTATKMVLNMISTAVMVRL